MITRHGFSEWRVLAEGKVQKSQTDSGPPAWQRLVSFSVRTGDRQIWKTSRWFTPFKRDPLSDGAECPQSSPSPMPLEISRPEEEGREPRREKVGTTDENKKRVKNPVWQV